MDFKLFLEASDELFSKAYSLGEMPRKEVQELIQDDDFMKSFLDRSAFTKNFGWSVPCKEAVDVIKKYAREPLYDVLAGTGYWAKILKKSGVNVIASDIHKILNKNNYHSNDHQTRDISNLVKVEKEKIIRRNALKVGYDLKRRRLKGDVFLSWPPYDEPLAFELAKTIPSGTRIFYIGEGKHGCTGDDNFHNYLCDNFNELHFELLPTFEGVHDSLYVYEKV